MASVEELSRLIEKELKNYKDGVKEGVKDAVSQTMKEFVSNTKADAPEKTGKYKKSISSKTAKVTSDEYSEIWYVKEPRNKIAHLLNNGHAKKNGGRVNGDGHITRNAESAKKVFEKRIEEVIQCHGH